MKTISPVSKLFTSFLIFSSLLSFILVFSSVDHLLLQLSFPYSFVLLCLAMSCVIIDLLWLLYLLLSSPNFSALFSNPLISSTLVLAFAVKSFSFNLTVCLSRRQHEDMGRRGEVHIMGFNDCFETSAVFFFVFRHSWDFSLTSFL